MTELTNLELFEVSLVDAGDDPLARVAIFKRAPERDKMTDEELKAKELAEQAKMEAAQVEKTALETQVTDLTKSLEEVTKELNDLKAETLAKEKPKDEMIEINGTMIAKALIPAPVLKELEDVRKEREVQDLHKRAETLLPNFKGTIEQRGKLLKSVGSDAELLEMLSACDALFATLMSEVGKADIEGSMKEPGEKLNDLAKQYATEKGVTFEKGFSAVIKTAEGKALYNQSNKK